MPTIAKPAIRAVKPACNIPGLNLRDSYSTGVAIKQELQLHKGGGQHKGPY